MQSAARRSLYVIIERAREPLPHSVVITVIVALIVLYLAFNFDLALNEYLMPLLIKVH